MRRCAVETCRTRHPVAKGIKLMSASRSLAPALLPAWAVVKQDLLHTRLTESYRERNFPQSPFYLCNYVAKTGNQTCSQQAIDCAWQTVFRCLTSYGRASTCRDTSCFHQEDNFIRSLLENYCFVLLTIRAPQISDNRPDMGHRALFVTSRATWRWNKMLLV